jgi:hypothetical protein
MILQLLSVLALLPLVSEMVDDQAVLEEGHFHHGLPNTVVAACHQYSIERVVVACYHCCS